MSEQETELSPGQRQQAAQIAARIGGAVTVQIHKYRDRVDVRLSAKHQEAAAFLPNIVESLERGLRQVLGAIGVTGERVDHT